ncbi:Uncharacterized protein PBTT_10203 [Plasmodiophora brassicae]
MDMVVPMAAESNILRSMPAFRLVAFVAVVSASVAYAGARPNRKGAARAGAANTQPSQPQGTAEPIFPSTTPLQVAAQDTFVPSQVIYFVCLHYIADTYNGMLQNTHQNNLQNANHAAKGTTPVTGPVPQSGAMSFQFTPAPLQVAAQGNFVPPQVNYFVCLHYIAGIYNGMPQNTLQNKLQNANHAAKDTAPAFGTTGGSVRQEPFPSSSGSFATSASSSQTTSTFASHVPASDAEGRIMAINALPQYEGWSFEELHYLAWLGGDSHQRRLQGTPHDTLSLQAATTSHGTDFVLPPPNTCLVWHPAAPVLAPHHPYHGTASGAEGRFMCSTAPQGAAKPFQSTPAPLQVAAQGNFVPPLVNYFVCLHYIADTYNGMPQYTHQNNLQNANHVAKGTTPAFGTTGGSVRQEPFPSSSGFSFATSAPSSAPTSTFTSHGTACGAEGRIMSIAASPAHAGSSFEELRSQASLSTVSHDQGRPQGAPQDTPPLRAPATTSQGTGLVLPPMTASSSVSCPDAPPLIVLDPPNQERPAWYGRRFKTPTPRRTKATSGAAQPQDPDHGSSGLPAGSSSEPPPGGSSEPPPGGSSEPPAGGSSEPPPGGSSEPPAEGSGESSGIILRSLKALVDNRIAAAVGATGLVAGGVAYKARLFDKSPVVAEPPQQRKQSKLGKAAVYTGAALAVASGVGAVAFADQIKAKAGENKVTNALVGIKDTVTGKNEQGVNDVNKKTTKNSASTVAIGATAFAAVAFAIIV